MFDFDTLIAPDDAIYAEAKYNEKNLKPLPVPPQTGLQDILTSGLFGMSLAPRIGNKAIAVAREYHQSKADQFHNLCLQCVRLDYGIGPLEPTALLAHDHAVTKIALESGEQAHRGYPVFWGEGDGHIAIAVGGGFCWTTDFYHYGGVDLARIDLITQVWGKPFLGETWDFNGVSVHPDTPAPPKFPKFREAEYPLWKSHQQLTELEAEYPQWSWIQDEIDEVWTTWKRIHLVNNPE